MHRSIILFTISLYLIFTTTAFSKQHQFKHFKLSPFLEERANILASGDPEQIRNVPPIPDDDNSDLYKKIEAWLRPRYMNIGQTQADAILKQSQNYDLGTHNYQGMSWRRPMGIFMIGGNRAVSPVSNGPKKWRVNDIFTISVGAVSYLKYLKNKDLIDIPIESIGLFAGIGFQRTYRFTHYADSYVNGLKSDFRKLFMTFMYFKTKRVLDLDDDESIYKENFFGVNTGVFLKFPLWNVLSGNIGGIVGTNKTSSLKITANLGETSSDKARRLAMVLHKNSGKTVGVYADLVLDFFKLFKLTMLSFNIPLEKTLAHNLSMNIPESAIYDIESGKLKKVFKKVLKMRKFDISQFNQFISFRDYRTTINKGTNQFYISRGSYHNKTEQRIDLINSKKEENSQFFKVIGVDTKYVKTLWMTLVNNIFLNRNKLSFIKKYPKIKNWLNKMKVNLDPLTGINHRKVELEYKANFVNDDKDLVSEENSYAQATNVSLKFHKYTKVGKTKGFLFKRAKRKFISYLTSQTNVGHEIIKQIEENKIKGPAEVSLDVSVNSSGMKAFSGMLDWEVHGIVNAICRRYNNLSSFSDRKRRKEERKCIKSIDKYYKKYKNGISKNQGVNVFMLKHFLKQIQKYGGFDTYSLLFGESNVGITGSVTAKNKKGKTYKTYFGTTNNKKILSVIEREKFNKVNEIH